MKLKMIMKMKMKMKMKLKMKLKWDDTKTTCSKFNSTQLNSTDYRT